MRSTRVVLALGGVFTAFSADSTCDDADVNSLLQARQLIRSGPALTGYGPGGQGACRTGEANDDEGVGMYSTAHHANNVQQCASECDASPGCAAFEFTTQSSGTTGCELHRQSMHGGGQAGGLCYNKVPAGPVLTGYGPGGLGACRTADDDEGLGMYSTAHHADNVEQCASECDASPGCAAFEFTTQSSGTTGCELHRQLMRGGGQEGGLCYNKVEAGPGFTGYGPANLGACRTADDRQGHDMLSRVDADSVEPCASQCDASPTCFAFEFTTRSSGATGCELHRQPMRGGGQVGGLCYNKVRAGPVLTGYGPGSLGACRTADGDEGIGMYSTAHHADNVEQCASECDASPGCAAFEFTTRSRGRTGCELHSQSMYGGGQVGGLCYNK